MGTKIIYNSAIIADLEGGQTATLKCKDLKMTSDVEVKAAEIPAEPVLQEKTVIENGEVTPDEGYDGLSKVTVNVESSGNGGGGSLPAGVYFEHDNIVQPTTKSHRLFEFNGETYAFTANSTGNSNYWNVYKFADGAWSQVLANESTTLFAIPVGGMSFVEHNGKIHIAGNDKTIHYTWDGGSTFVSKAAIPETVCNGGMVSLGGTLYAYGGSCSLMAWDEETDTWSTVVSNALLRSSACLMNINDELWASSGNFNIYKFTNGAFEQVFTATQPVAANFGYAVLDGCVYYSKYLNTTVCELLKFDSEALAEISLGKMPKPEIGTNQQLRVADGKIKLRLGGNSDQTANYAYFTIHIIE